ncbi:7TM diverse intracellular signaling domain-containing protein [Marinobacter gelidimuriae]|uniref:7TM diverse intracellular signaling domain-containing protein n=1 Tax=Marinobacter gelidimuriae TaxID=2739064 RepID=UPI001E3EE50E|nr:7TM-DISM domain-containing protein [Marinobacter gelidimuriae]
MLLFISSFSAQASPTLDIGQEAIRLTDFRVEYFTDDSQSLSYEEVRKQTFQETTSRTSLGTNAAVTWFRFTLRNSSLKARALFLHLPNAYHVRSVDIFQERSQNLIDQASVDQLAMVLYNALLYFATSKSENIFYSLYLISGLTWIALSYGLPGKAFNVYGDAAFVLNLAVISMPIFLLLFMMSIFETREFYRTEHRGLEDIRSKQNEFKQQAATDPLTQLYNRRHFVSEGEYMVEKARAAGSLCLLSHLILTISKR